MSVLYEICVNNPPAYEERKISLLFINPKSTGVGDPSVILSIQSFIDVPSPKEFPKSLDVPVGKIATLGNAIFAL